MVCGTRILFLRSIEKTNLLMDRAALRQHYQTPLQHLHCLHGFALFLEVAAQVQISLGLLRIIQDSPPQLGFSSLRLDDQEKKKRQDHRKIIIDGFPHLKAKSQFHHKDTKSTKIYRDRNLLDLSVLCVFVVKS